MTFPELMERSRQWDSNLAQLMRDHEEYRSRLEAAMKSPTERASVGNGAGDKQ